MSEDGRNFASSALPWIGVAIVVGAALLGLAAIWITALWAPAAGFVSALIAIVFWLTQAAFVLAAGGAGGPSLGRAWLRSLGRFARTPPRFVGGSLPEPHVPSGSE